MLIQDVVDVSLYSTYVQADFLRCFGECARAFVTCGFHIRLVHALVHPIPLPAERHRHVTEISTKWFLGWEQSKLESVDVLNRSH